MEFATRLCVINNIKKRKRKSMVKGSLLNLLILWARDLEEVIVPKNPSSMWFGSIRKKMQLQCQSKDRKGKKTRWNTKKGLRNGHLDPCIGFVIWWDWWYAETSLKKTFLSHTFHVLFFIEWVVLFAIMICILG